MNERTQGIALVTALAILVVVGILVAGSFLSTQLELGITKNDTTSIQAKYVADAGLEKYKAALFQYYRYVENTLNNDTTNPTRTACYSRIGQGLDWNRNDTTSLVWNNNKIAFTSGSGEPVYAADGSTIIGRYQVTLYRDPAEPRLFTLVSEGTSHGARATIRAVVELNNTGVLQQAIFAGHGQANKFVNGGATIRGGIYVVGDKGSPTTVFNSNGNFSQLNDYNLTNDTRYASMVGRVSSANQVADNLCASLRVEYGQVDLSGSVKIGDPNNKLLGVYIGQDVSQDLVVNQTLLQCAQTKGICTDNGPSSFDLDPKSAPQFPTLDDHPTSDQGCPTSDSWRTCIHRDAVDNGIKIEYNGGSPQVVTPTGTTLGNNEQGCLDALAASKSRTLAFGTDPIDCTVKVNGNNKYGFSYQPGTPGSLKVYGTLDFQGFNLQFNQPTEYFAETQKASGTVYNASLVVEKDDSNASGNTAGGDIDLNANMLTGNTAGYPDYPNHVLAFVAENDVFQGGSSVMAPIYAGGTYRIVSNNTLVGSVISDYFCTTGAGGTTNEQKKQNSKASTDKCNAGQNSEVVYVNTGNNKPAIMRYIQFAGVPIFAVQSTETR